MRKMIRQEHLTYLDVLRETGITNMYGARPYLINAYPKLTKDEAGKVLNYWMTNFNIEGTKIKEEERNN